MNRFLVVALAALLALPVAVPATAGVESETEAVHVLVATAGSTETRARLLADHGGRAVHRYARFGIDLVEVPDGTDPATFAALLATRREVRYAVPDRRWYAATDPDFGLLWGLENQGQTIRGTSGTVDVDVDAPAAWVTTKGEGAVVVGVVDEGIDVTHPDLYERIFLNADELPPPTTDDGDGVLTVRDYADTPDVNANGYVDADDLRAAYSDGADGPDANTLVDDIAGWDFAHGDAQVWDGAAGQPCGGRKVDDHGTHVAGTIAASENGVGVVGVAPRILVMPLKFLACGGGDTSDALAALEYAEGFGVRILNHSWGAGSADPALRAGMATTDRLHLAAAGNSRVDADQRPLYPAAYDLPNVVSVAALDNGGGLASFSNFGRRSVDLGAPGKDVYSTFGGARYAYLSGTSMATPHVTGIAALVLSAVPATTTPRVVEALSCGAEPVASLWDRTVTGGQAKADATLAALDVPGPPSSVAASTTEDAVTVTWEPPTTLAGATVTGYEARVEPSGATQVLGAGARAATFDGLERGAVHRISVAATTSTGPGCRATLPVIIAGPPDAPASVSATAGDSTVTVLWQPPADDNGAPVESYVVTLHGTDGSSHPRTPGASARSVAIAGLVNGVAYTAEIRAVNEAGPGLAAVSDAVTPVGVPEAPFDVTATPRDRGASVRWSAPPSDGGAPITTYHVDAFLDGATATSPVVSVTVSAPAASAEVRGLTNGTAYTFTVAAENGPGRGPASARSQAVIPQEPLAAPDAFVATPGNRSIAATWQVVDDADDYVLTAEPGGHVAVVEGTTAELRDLANGTAYRLEVAARRRGAAGLRAVARATPTAPTLVRTAGGDRYETAAEVSRRAFPGQVDTVYLATGAAFPDALAAAAAAGSIGAPVLLTRPDILPAATAAELTRLAPGRLIIVGGEAAISESVALDATATSEAAVAARLWGPDRYATAAAVSSEAFSEGGRTVYLATGADFPDALALAATSGGNPGPVLLVGPDGLPDGTAAELRRLRPDRVVLAGGERAVDPAVAREVAAVTGRPVERIAGADRYETAAALVAAYADSYPAVVHVATGGDFPDAISAGAVAAASVSPLLLVPRDGAVPTTVASELSRLRPAAIEVVGGTAAISDAVAALVRGAAS